LRVADGELVGAQRHAETARADVDPPGLDAAHHLIEALALALGPTQDRGGGHAVVVERDLRRLDALVAELREALGRDRDAALPAGGRRPLSDSRARAVLT